jgi:hypothetical protein
MEEDSIEKFPSENFSDDDFSDDVEGLDLDD